MHITSSCESTVVPPPLAGPLHRQGGFTLVELFAVVAIAAILAAVAVPAMQQWILNNARTTRLNSLVLALNLARNEAISNRQTVTICRAVLPDVACNSAGGTGDQWETGWVVRRDVNNDGDITDTPEDLRRAFAPDIPATGSFRATDGANDIAQVRYGPAGRVLNPPGSPVRFVLCDSRGATEARAVILSFGGQPRVSRDANNDGTHEVDGVNITCP